MEQSRQAQMNNYRAFGRRPGNRNMTVEKPQNGKKTLKRLMGYFVSEKKMLFLLMLAVVVVVASVVVVGSSVVGVVVVVVVVVAAVVVVSEGFSVVVSAVVGSSPFSPITFNSTKSF